MTAARRLAVATMGYRGGSGGAYSVPIGAVDSVVAEQAAEVVLSEANHESITVYDAREIVVSDQSRDIVTTNATISRSVNELSTGNDA
mgnify:CR=1 FL=1